MTQGKVFFLFFSLVLTLLWSQPNETIKEVSEREKEKILFAETEKETTISMIGYKIIEGVLIPEEEIEDDEKIFEKGVASWYGPRFHKKMTANGEIFNMYDFTAAHKELAFGTVVRVTHLENEKYVDVRINDRGPFVEGRIIDLSMQAAREIEMKEEGISKVKVEIIKTP